MQIRAWIHGEIYTPWRHIKDGLLLARGETIEYVGGYDPGMVPIGAEVIDIQGKILAPGLIDIHVHGGGGYDVMDGRVESVLGLAQTLARSGVTGFCPSLYAGSRQAMEQAITVSAQAAGQIKQGAQILGIHIEAPFMNPEARGGQDIAYIRPPQMDEVEAMVRAGQGLVKIILVAPEVEGARELVRYCRAHEIVPAIGHSEASYEQVLESVEWGISHVEHTFNGSGTGLTKRAPGVVGAALNIEDLTNELICDGIHVHPANMQILYKLKGVERMILVSDALSVAGLPDGVYPMGGRNVVLKDGVAVIQGQTDGNLAGSALTLNRGVKKMVDLVGAPFSEALRMATINPANRIGLQQKGVLSPGYDADLAVFDQEMNCHSTVVKGQTIYQA